ncbi:MAG: histidine phosphatase family protein [Chloroflexota bacterium]
MTSIIVCRHGATDWNLLGRYQGQSDIPLNSDGERQALTLGEELRSELIQAVYASALQRAWRTAETIAGYHGLEVRRDARFNEVDEGAWEGLTLEEIVDHYPEQHADWVKGTLESRPTNGESIGEMRVRISAALAEIVLAWPEGKIVIVAHKVTLNVLRSVVTGEPTETTLRNLPLNGSLYRWEIPASIADGRLEGAAL